MTQEIYDTTIIGGGPAGAGAAVYTGRKKMKTLLLTEEFGGQSVVSSGIENWIGEEMISGDEFAKKIERHVRAQGEVEIGMPEKVVKVEDPGRNFIIKTEQGSSFLSRTVIVASGARRRRLKVPGEDRFEGRGVSFCSTCDAPFFSDQEVAVVGSGNAAIETVIDLFPYARRIYLIVRGQELKGDPVTRERVTASGRVNIIYQAEVEKILGEQTVSGLLYRDKKAERSKDLPIGGIFIEVGSTPNSEFIRGIVETNEAGEIVIDPRTARTSREGIFAAGDVTNDPFKQNNISAGDGVRAALSAYTYLLKITKSSPCAAEE
jgi:alkyl hydroperoxide reductase subunit AhpF